MERIKNVLFDLDGTLTDPAEGITNALMHAQRRLGRPVLYQIAAGRQPGAAADSRPGAGRLRRAPASGSGRA